MTAPIRALLIDMDGVLYQGSRVVPGAVEALRWLNEQRIPRLFVTNTTSRPRSALVDKLAGMGIRVAVDAILTPPVAAVRWLSEHVDGPVALFVPEATRAELATLRCIGPADPEPDGPVAAVVIGDYGEGWTYAALNRAFRWLMQPSQPPLVALGMTRYWQAEDGLRLDTAPFVVALAHAAGREPVVLGKPARPFFQAALDHLGVAAAEALMIGDDIRGDVGGAQAAGIGGLLVKTGKYRPRDLSGDIEPRAVLDSIADLPAWWERRA